MSGALGPESGGSEGALAGDGRYRALFDRCAEAVFFHDAATRTVVDANPAFLRLLGYAPDELPALTLYDVVAHPRDNVDEHVGRVLEDGAGAVGRRLWRRKDGVQVDVDVSLGRVRHDGRDLVFAVARALADAGQAAALPQRAPGRPGRAAGSKGRGTATAGALSRRETQVLKLLGLGYSNHQIATRLKLSVKTVETFRARIYKKLRIRGRPALVRHALRSGLVTLEDSAAEE